MCAKGQPQVSKGQPFNPFTSIDLHSLPGLANVQLAPMHAKEPHPYCQTNHHFPTCLSPFPTRYHVLSIPLAISSLPPHLHCHPFLILHAKSHTSRPFPPFVPSPFSHSLPLKPIPSPFNLGRVEHSSRKGKKENLSAL